MTPPKKKYPYAEAMAVAKELCELLAPFCERIIIAGSLRRRRAKVGDVEIVFIPKVAEEKEDLFGTKRVSLADRRLDWLLNGGVIAKRPNVNGAAAWGDKNKLGLHVASGIPVDFFTTSERAWFNYLVCRTGGRINNTNIAVAAKRQGLMWHPYSYGFASRSTGNMLVVKSEKDVYAFAGLKYLEPHQRP
jgi:DNA polymerase/3'-5' exonuclease PolX